MVVRWLALLAGVTAALACGIGAAVAQPQGASGKRYALLIGINAYRDLPPLAKAVGDASALGAALTGFGYEVTVVKDATRRELNEALARFTAQLKPEDTAVIHYSGHGIEIAQQNFLLPADTPKLPAGIGTASTEFIRGEAIALGDLMGRIADTGVGVRIFIIDACRDNPFAATGTRGVGRARGLNISEPLPGGSFVFYSAGMGQQALDNLGRTDTAPTSVYTRALLKHMKRDGSVSDIAQDVRREVRDMAARIGHAQSPAYYDEFIGSNEFYLDPAKDPKRGWVAACQLPPGEPVETGWTHNGQDFKLVADGARRRFHYVTPRKSLQDQGVKPDCLLIDGVVDGARFKAKAHIYRAACGAYAYDVEGDWSPGTGRLELRGPAPVPLESCKIARFETTGPRTELVFVNAAQLASPTPGPAAPGPVAPTPVAAPVTPPGAPAETRAPTPAALPSTVSPAVPPLPVPPPIVPARPIAPLPAEPAPSPVVPSAAPLVVPPLPIPLPAGPPSAPAEAVAPTPTSAPPAGAPLPPVQPPAAINLDAPAPAGAPSSSSDMDDRALAPLRLPSTPPTD
jgi:hypothetical protein